MITPPLAHAGDYKARRPEHYWCRGAGLAKWAGRAHPWTTLVARLSKHMPNT